MSHLVSMYKDHILYLGQRMLLTLKRKCNAKISYIRLVCVINVETTIDILLYGLMLRNHMTCIS